LKWSKGKALVATGSPFDPVTVDGKQRRIGQANNVFVFPGIGLGAIITEASEITDGMIGAAANALAKSLSAADIAENSLTPNISRLWEVCGDVALAVAQQAIEDGVAGQTDADSLQERLDEYRWRPAYPEIVLAKDSN
jgi:malate dehydrogenase (oxaloacetate-decarboxylating)